MAVDVLVDNDIRTNSGKWNECFLMIMRQARTMLVAMKHPAVPLPAKLVAACSVGYIFSPIQLIPTFIPIIGQLDDLAVLLVGMKLLRRLTPPAILSECERNAHAKKLYIAPPYCPSTECQEREAA